MSSDPFKPGRIPRRTQKDPPGEMNTVQVKIYKIVGFGDCRLRVSPSPLASTTDHVTTCLSRMIVATTPIYWS